MNWSRGKCGRWVGPLVLCLGLVAFEGRAAGTPPEVCSEGGWCWKSPAAPTDTFEDAWALDEHSVLAVGPPGRVLYWRDGETLSLPSGTSGTLHAIWAASAHDAWAVGQAGAIVHWNGVEWTRVREKGPALVTVFGTRADEVWAAGEEGTLLHWNGVRWEEVPSGTTGVIRALWASGPNDVWVSVVEDEDEDHPKPSVRRWNGEQWLTLPSVHGEVHALWGRGPGDVWAAGERGLLAHWTGLSWAQVPGTDRDYPFSSVRGSSSGDLWIGGYLLWRFDGERMHPQEFDTFQAYGFGAIAIHGDKPLLAVGQEGVLLRPWEGERWDVQVARPRFDFKDVWVNSPTQAWATRSDGLLSRWDGTSWRQVPDLDPMALYGVSGSSASDVWVVGRSLRDDKALIVHFDGRGWRQWAFGTAERFTDVWALDANTAWVVEGSGNIYRWRRGEWNLDSTQKHVLLGVHGSSEDNVWAVGMHGALLHWDGRRWVDHSFTGPELRAVWVSGPEDVWMAADDGAIWHWDGQRAVRASGDRWMSVKAFQGRGAKDVWAVGDQGAMFHWDGQTWSPVASGTRQPLNSIGGAGDRLFTVGRGATILQRD
jgi:hypothetical protein